MSDITMKCVMIIDTELPIGIKANTSAVLGITLGKELPHEVGPDVTDASGQTHLGITSIPVTMLGGEKNQIKEIRKRLYSEEFSDLLVVDFSNVAQCCHVYEDYIKMSADTMEQDYHYFGIAIYGNKKKVNKITGSMPLLK